MENLQGTEVTNGRGRRMECGVIQGIKDEIRRDVERTEGSGLEEEGGVGKTSEREAGDKLWLMSV